MKINKEKIIELIMILTLIIYLEPQMFKENAFVGVTTIDFIYKILKLGLALIIWFFYFFKKKKPSKLVFLLFCLQGTMALSTIINNGAILRYIGPATTTITMAMVGEMLIDSNKLINVLKKVNVYLLISFIINLISIFLIDFTPFEKFTKVYFLGIDNRFVFTFIPWIFFEGITSLAEHKTLNKKWLIITILCELILLYKSSVAAMLAMLIFTFSFFVYNRVSNISEYNKSTFLSYLVLNVSIIIFKIQNVFSKLIIFLGKDITLSGRTYIWDGILKSLKQNILIGTGMQSISYDKNFFFESSAPFFLEHCKVIHAHNSLMTLLYRGGIISLLIYIYIIYITLRSIKTEKKSIYSGLLYTTIIVILILSLFDTMDFACLYFIIAIALNISKLKTNSFIEKNCVIDQKINKIIKILKKIIKKIYRIIAVMIFNLFPIKKDRIIISSYYGKGYGDSGKYIVEELIKKNKNYDIYWMIENDNLKQSLPKYVKPVKKDSLKYFYTVCTSKVWIDNRRPIIELTKRKKQFYIQTWHGGIALKKIEGDAENKLPKRYIKCAKKDSKAIDLMVSNSSFCTQMYRRAFWYNGRIEEYGTPRNDILMNEKNHKGIKEKVHKNLKIKNKYNLIMYAPTFRADENLECYNIEYEKLLNYLNSNMDGNWKLLLKLHPNIANKSKELLNLSDQIVDASSYNDMYELMIASDILITDYSSIMFEFSFMRKPVFLYASDIENYIDERGMYFEYQKMPYPIAENTSKLIKNIKKFNPEKYKNELDLFFKRLGLKETGKASELVAEEIIRVIEGENNE